MPKTVVKRFRKYKHNSVNGIGRTAAYLLELRVYQRLTGFKNFPTLIDYDNAKCELTLEFCGDSLRDLRKKQISDLVLDIDLECQVNSIVNCLEQKNIQYVDVSGQNICVKHGTVYLIDFDSAILDGMPLTEERELFLDKFYAEGGYNNLKNSILYFIEKRFNVKYDD